MYKFNDRRGEERRREQVDVPVDRRSEDRRNVEDRRSGEERRTPDRIDVSTDRRSTIVDA